jgi:hypothetical protein
MKREGIVALPSAAEVVFLKVNVVRGLAERE